LLGPESAHSPNADDLNAAYWVMLVVAGVLVIAINAALIGLAVRYRAARGLKPRRFRSRPRAQLVAAGALAGLATVVFGVGVSFTESSQEVEASGPEGLEASSVRLAQRGLELPGGEVPEPLTIKVSGQQWIWRYEYPDGTFSYYELVVPVDTAVVIELDSTDVVHRWSVPGLGGRFDAVPGEANTTWFKADREGVFRGSSYAFSGASYAAMRTQVRVVSVPEYEAWLDEQASDIQEAQRFVAEQLAEAGGPGISVAGPEPGAEQP
jgi:cytochrome c oxidase subunit 2